MPTRGDQQRTRTYAEAFGVDYNVARRALDAHNTSRSTRETLRIPIDSTFRFTAGPCPECSAETERRAHFVWWPHVRTTCLACEAWPLDIPVDELLAALPGPWTCSGCGRGPGDAELVLRDHRLDTPQFQCAALAAAEDCEAGTRRIEDIYDDSSRLYALPYASGEALRAEVRRRRAAERFGRHVDLQRDEGFTAERSWSVEARIRLRRDVGAGNSYGNGVTYKAGEEWTMYQTGNRGREVDCHWWSSFDIDGAYILEPADVDVLEVITATSPYIDDRPAPRTSIRRR